MGDQAKTRTFLRSENGYDVWQETSAADFGAFVISDPDGGAQEMADDINDTPASLVTLEVCYTPRGEYIGAHERANYLAEKDIIPECLLGHNVCSIGWCPSEAKWYGWSHRAIYGFGIGDCVKEGDCTASSGWTDEYLAEHPEADTSLPVGFEARNFEDCRKMAIAFAESVS